MLNKFERVSSPDDPNRCQATHANLGQCPFRGMKKEDGTFQKYCARHQGGNVVGEIKQSMDLYRAAQWQARIKGHSEHPSLKTLHNEVGICRILLEERLSQCKDTTELLMASSTISELLDKIQRLVSSCHKLDKDLGQMLDKAQALKLAADFVQIINQFIDDPFILETIAEELIASVDQTIKQGPIDLK